MKLHETPHEKIIHFHESPRKNSLWAQGLWASVRKKKNSGGVRENELDGTGDVQIYLSYPYWFRPVFVA